VLWELDIMDNNDTDLGPNNNVFDEKIDKLISRLYWDAKCGRAAAEYNLQKAGMIEMIFGHVAGQMRDGDNFWDDCRWTSTERGRSTSMADLQRIVLSDPPLDIALWDAQDEAADAALKGLQFKQSPEATMKHCPRRSQGGVMPVPFAGRGISYLPFREPRV
jgi:hypothetical protein